MYIPNKFKHKKLQKRKIKRSEYKLKAVSLQYGQFGLQASEPGRINPKQIEAARRALVRKTAKLAKIWIRIFPDTPVTSKPEAVRMGKGKGAVDYWVFKVQTGRMLFELTGISQAIAREACFAAARKLPMNSRFVFRLN